MKLLFFDLETTGVKFWRNGIHQIGGIVDIDGQEVERFDIRLAPNPAATIEQEALDNERERMITVISGRKCLESYERQDRSGLLARMLLESPIWFNPVVKLTWKRKVIKMKKITRKRYLSKNISSIPSATILNVKDIPSNRSLFQLAVSERHTRGTGYGSLLPTVQTQGLKVCDKDGKTRFMDLSSLPKQGIKYGDLLPTPVASDHTGSCTIRKMTKSNGAPRTDSLRNMPAVIGMDGDRLNGRVFQLSPLFVEEMMGNLMGRS